MDARRIGTLAVVALAAVAPAATATIPGENGEIAFTRTYSDGRSELWRFDRTSSELEAQIEVSGTVRQPTWCHERLVFSPFAQPTAFRINRWLQSLPAGFTTEVAWGSADRPSCAPAGDAVAFSGGNLGNSDIHRVAPGGGLPQRLTSDPGDDHNPDWSPDGGRIAFQSDRDGDLDVYVMGAGGGEQTRITSNGGEDSEPSWAPDGTRIAYYSDGPPAGVWVMNADGSGARFLVEGREPAWSPDGTLIAYRDSTAADGGRVWTITPAGGSPQGLTAGGAVDLVTGDRTPAWRPIRPVPVLAGAAAATPARVPAGTPGYRLRVTGSRFIIGSVVTWNGAPRPTIHLGPTELAADLSAADLATPGTARVGVATPPPGGGVSALTFDFTVAGAGGPGGTSVTPGPGGGTLAVTAASAAGRWRASALRGGRLTVSGRAAARAVLRIEARQGRRVVGRRSVPVGAGAWSAQLPLAPGTLPGAITVVVAGGGGAPIAAQARLAPPPEGVAARAWISVSAGGPVRPRLRPGLSALVANFRLAALPARGRPLAVVWRVASFTTRVRTFRPEGRLITAQLFARNGGRIGSGRWTATLLAGGVPVAVARVRVG